MKAAMVTVLGQPLEVVETEIPKIEPHQILVKTRACGVCHTDLHAAAGDWPVKPRLPLIPGHEGVGEVEDVGAGLPDAALAHHRQGDVPR